ncbi:hypothetical protein Clacol_001175 [Clathrus columnatus]|uniref:Uncharacterized protein n=1 Tax=Clathrus columnatus TaxID=1419009 RepID=A0AAV4ZXT5_9AGAM|nr:hypothetical protein Clacol_001175 [Clathrus columnatus]
MVDDDEKVAQSCRCMGHRVRINTQKNIIIRSVHKALAAALDDLSSSEMWTQLQRVFQQVESDSIVFWLRQLIRKAEGTHTMKQHLESFQTSLRHLENAEVTFEEHVKAAMLLATLPDDSTDSADSWAGFVSGLQANETTQLSAVVISILVEIRERKVKSLENVKPK